MFSAMGGMLVVSLSIPDAFGDRGVLFGCAYFFVRAHAARALRPEHSGCRGRGDLQAVLKLAPGFLLGSALIIVAGFLDGGARASIWILAILVDWSTPLLFGTEEFHLDPAHFAERHGLIVMIALGESILAIGAAAEFTLSAGQVFAALFGIAAVAALWWAYFDVVAIVAERRLSEAPPGEQAPLARDAYSYLHFPLIAGIVLLALGLKETLALTGEPLETVPALALCGGPALYLLGQIAFRERMLGTFSPHRALAGVALLALIPLALGADALVALAAVATVLAILIAYEAVHFREQRARVRANPSATLAEMRG